MLCTMSIGAEERRHGRDGRGDASVPAPTAGGLSGLRSGRRYQHNHRVFSWPLHLRARGGGGGLMSAAIPARTSLEDHW